MGLAVALTVLGGIGIVVGVVVVVGGMLMTRDVADRAGIGRETWTVLSILPLAGGSFGHPGARRHGRLPLRRIRSDRRGVGRSSVPPVSPSPGSS